MKKFLILCLVGFCMSLTGCKSSEYPANAEYIGSGYIQYDKGIYYVEIDSVKYSPREIYTNKKALRGYNMMAPVEGLKVTCFRRHGKPQVEFIAGEQSKEYLEDNFKTHPTVGIIVISIFAATAIVLVPICGLIIVTTCENAIKNRKP